MHREKIFDTITILISERFGTDRATLTLETRQSDIQLDSILLVDLMMDLEEALGVRLEDFDLPKNPRLADIVELVERNVKTDL